MSNNENTTASNEEHRPTLGDQMGDMRELLKGKRNSEGMTAENLDEAAARLNEQANRAREEADRQRAANDAREEGVGGPIEKKKSNTLKTVRKVLGYTAGVGVIGLGGYYLVGYLRGLGAEVPAAVDDAVANLGEAVAAAISGQ